MAFSIVILVLIHLFPQISAGGQYIGRVYRGVEGAQMNWIDSTGIILLSSNSVFGFGFRSTETDPSLYLLSVIHLTSSQAIWTANRGSPVSNYEKFIFSDDGNLLLSKSSSVVWTSNTTGKGIVYLELQNSGNLVAVGSDNKEIWRSFDHPTNSLVSTQNFTAKMKLVSDPSPDNSTFTLEIINGDVVLSAAFAVPQPYWSSDSKANVTMASMGSNSLKFYDSDSVLLREIVFSDKTEKGSIWVALLNFDGFIYFYDLTYGGTSGASSSVKIPSNFCSRPNPCGRYYACSDGNKCFFPLPLAYQSSIGANHCDSSNKVSELVNLGDGFAYFALPFVSPDSVSDLSRCKESCKEKCSCRAMFFNNVTGSCFLFSEIGGFQKSALSSFIAYVKTPKRESHGGSSNHILFVVLIVTGTIFIICSVLVTAFRCHKRGRYYPQSPYLSDDENAFFDDASGMPLRFSYEELETATKSFSVKLGKGGFGSVYDGILMDGSRIAVKKLEGIEQGKKEFRAEVTTIGSIHHHHLMRLKGFCAEGGHRLLAYEYMENGSLDKWIFNHLLDWDTRFKIAIGTAKGLAYLHEECDLKIIHCDIKPENVLLDGNFVAKVSDFGLAKLMTKEKSKIFTRMRGTRGYLAPEWLTRFAISEKSDVYSYGMLLLEIVGGRKNFDPSLSPERSHFPAYAMKMVKEERFAELTDSEMEVDEEDERVATCVKVALWCIQDEMSARPSMTKVVQMLEGLSQVLQPPSFSLINSYGGVFKSTSTDDVSFSSIDDNKNSVSSTPLVIENTV